MLKAFHLIVRHLTTQGYNFSIYVMGYNISIIYKLYSCNLGNYCVHLFFAELSITNIHIVYDLPSEYHTIHYLIDANLAQKREAMMFKGYLGLQ